MKRYLPLILAATVPVVVLIVLYATAPAAQTPRAKLDFEIEQNLATARRLLAAYEPGRQMLRAATDRLVGSGGVLEFNDQRVARVAEKWGDVSARIPDHYLKPVSAEVERELQRAQAEFRRLNGELPEGPPPADHAAAALTDVTTWLDANDKLLTDAIALVDAALGMTSTGEDLYSGRDHAEANRLRAILAYHRAESLRRSAALEREKIDRLHNELIALHGKWLAASSDLAVAERLLNGGELAGTAAVSSASQPSHEAAAAAPAVQPRPARSRFWSGVFAAISGRRAEAPAAPEAAPATQEAAPGEEKPARPLPPAMVEPMAQRIARYEQEKAAALDRAAKLQEQVRSLEAAIASLESDIRAKREEAARADGRMVAMEKAGFERQDAAALDRQIAEYESASRTNRSTARAADLLEYGGYTNARLVSADEEWHKAAVEPATQEPLKAQKSLATYRQELDSAKASLAGEQALAAFLTNRISALKSLQGDLEAQIAGRGGAATQPSAPGLKARRDALRQEVEKTAATIREAAAKAAEAEESALTEIEKGVSAAQQAGQAVNRRQGDARSAQPAEGPPNPRLELIQNEQWRAGDADALVADLRLLKSWVLYQRSVSRRDLAETLSLLRMCGIDADAAAEETAAAEDERLSLEEAKAAAELYDTKVQSAFKNDWTVHVNAAAAYYLMSKLTQGQPSEEYRKRAAQEYQLATQGQETNPDRQPYVARLNTLAKSLQPAAAR